VRIDGAPALKVVGSSYGAVFVTIALKPGEQVAASGVSKLKILLTAS